MTTTTTIVSTTFSETETRQDDDDYDDDSYVHVVNKMLFSVDKKKRKKVRSSLYKDERVMLNIYIVLIKFNKPYNKIKYIYSISLLQKTGRERQSSIKSL